jgi:TonB-dependent receptor
MRSSFRGRASKLGASLAVLALIATTATSAAAQASAQTQSIPLAEALMRLGQTSGHTILFDPRQVAGKMVRPVEGEAFESALKQLLMGTGMAYVDEGRGQISIVVDRSPKAPTKVKKRAASSADAAPAGSVSDVVVTAQRVAKDAATLQMSSDHEQTVVTAEDLARSPDTNVAEALARVAGVALLPTTIGGSLGGSAFMIDNAARGEGGYISVRGLGPDYAVDLMNGADIAQGKPASRQVELALLPPLGFSRIEISKSATAANDGDSISGIVDFKDATAFDIGRDLTTLSIQGDFNQNNADFGLFKHPFNGGGLAQAEISRVSPSGNFGFHAVGYYSQRNFSSSVFNENEGEWDFLYTYTGSDHTPVKNISPTNNLIGEQLNAQVSYGATTRYGGNASLDWKGAQGTAFVRGSYAYAQTEQNTVQRGAQATNDGANPNANGTYTTFENDVVGTYWFETNPEVELLGNIQVGGSTQFSNIHVDALAFLSYGEDNRPNHVETAYKNFQLDPSGDFNLTPTYAGNPAYPVPNLSRAQIAEINNIADYTPQTSNNFGSAGIDKNTSSSNQALAGLKFDFKADTGLAFLPDINFGLKFSDSRRDSTNRDYEYDNPNGILPGLAPTLNLSPFLDGAISSPALGAQRSIYPYYTPLLNAGALLAYINTLPLSYASAGYGVSWAGGTADFLANYNQNTQIGNEIVSAVYADAPFQFGKLEVMPGLRFEHTDINNTYWTQNTDSSGNPTTGSFQHDATAYNEPLPSLFLTYRPNTNAVYRASYWTSYVRPSLFLLGGGETITPLGDNVFQISEGNPKLKPVTAQNFDVSGEWNTDVGFHASVSAFYKLLRDYLFDAGSSTGKDGTHYVNTFSTITSATTVYQIPHNGGDATAAGLELSADQKMVFLPSPLSNLVLSGNVTLQHTTADLNLSGIANGGPMQYAPSLAYNLRLFYESSKLEAGLSYHYEGKFLETYYTYSNTGTSSTGAPLPNVDISWWDQATQRLDFSSKYALTPQLKIGFSAQNLLNNVSYYATRGKDSNLIPEIVQPGRTYTAQMTWSF